MSITKSKGEEFYLDNDFKQIANELGASIEQVDFTLVDNGSEHTLSGALKSGVELPQVTLNLAPVEEAPAEPEKVEEVPPSTTQEG